MDLRQLLQTESDEETISGADPRELPVEIGHRTSNIRYLPAREKVDWGHALKRTRAPETQALPDHSVYFSSFCRAVLSIQTDLSNPKSLESRLLEHPNQKHHLTTKHISRMRKLAGAMLSDTPCTPTPQCTKTSFERPLTASTRSRG